MVVAMYIILVYDIVLDEKGPGVLRRTYKTCKRYLHHIQNSVFEGELTKAQYFELTSALKEIIRDDRDSLIVFKSRHERWLEKDILGVDNNATDLFI